MAAGPYIYITTGGSSLGQFGTTVAGVWSDAPANPLTNMGHILEEDIGIIFDFTARAGGATRPQVVVGRDHNWAANLGVETPGAAVADLGWNIFFVNELEPDDYSNSALPGVRDNELQIATVSPGDFVGAALHTFQIEASTDYATNQAVMRSMMMHAGWNKRLALSFVSTETGTNVHTMSRPLITSFEHDFHSGHAYGGQRSRSRARHCARSGLPAHTAELIEDGYTEGWHVLPDWWEPEDIKTRHPIELPDTESDIDDKNTGSS
jgi:hypothetical protein